MDSSAGLSQHTHTHRERESTTKGGEHLVRRSILVLVCGTGQKDAPLPRGLARDGIVVVLAAVGRIVLGPLRGRRRGRRPLRIDAGGSVHLVGHWGMQDTQNENAVRRATETDCCCLAVGRSGWAGGRAKVGTELDLRRSTTDERTRVSEWSACGDNWGGGEPRGRGH